MLSPNWDIHSPKFGQIGIDPYLNRSFQEIWGIPKSPCQIHHSTAQFLGLPSGKQPHNYGKSPCLRGKLTINGHVQWKITIFHSYFDITRGYIHGGAGIPRLQRRSHRTRGQPTCGPESDDPQWIIRRLNGL